MKFYFSGKVDINEEANFATVLRNIKASFIFRSFITIFTFGLGTLARCKKFK